MPIVLIVDMPIVLIHSFIAFVRQMFIKPLPGVVVGSWDAVVNKTCKNPCPCLGGGQITDKNQ